MRLYPSLIVVVPVITLGLTVVCLTYMWYIIPEDKCSSEARFVPLPGKQRHSWHHGHNT